MLQDTLNVKLRYEEIIKAIMDNERRGNEHSVQEIIRKTESSKVVQIDKAKQAMMKQSTLTYIDVKDPQ